MTSFRLFRGAAACLVLATLTFNGAYAAEVPMDNERLGRLIQRIDENAEGQPGFWRAIIAGRAVTVITDENADRMRIISPVVQAEDLDPELMFRLLQANFDTALDARYSIAATPAFAASSSCCADAPLHPRAPTS